MTTVPEARPSTGVDRERQVRTIFSEIAPRYDLLNHVLSMNIDRLWRRRAVDAVEWSDRPSGRYLDACAGTCDLAVELASRSGFTGRVAASDFAQPMLREGRPKLSGLPVGVVCGDAQRLPFPDESFDGVLVAFGVRNLSNLDAGLDEFRRVLRPGRRLVVLEFTTPPNPCVRATYLFYFNRVLPVVGRIVSGHPWAYSYLPASVRDFPGPEPLADRMRDAGFREARWSLLSLGIAAIHVGVK